MMNRLARALITGATTAAALCALAVNANTANAFPPSCAKNGETLTCIGVYEGGAHGVQFVRIANPYNFSVGMRSTDDTSRKVCVEAHGYFYVEPATREAGIIVLSAGQWVPGAPLAC